MVAVEPGAVLCRGLGGLPRSTSTTRRVYQGLGDPANYPFSPSHPHTRRGCRNCRESPGFAFSFLFARKFCANAVCALYLFLSLSRKWNVTLKFCITLLRFFGRIWTRRICEFYKWAVPLKISRYSLLWTQNVTKRQIILRFVDSFANMRYIFSSKNVHW